MQLKFFLNLFVLLCTTLSCSAQQVIQLYKGRPQGSETWHWEEQTSDKNMLNSPRTFNVSQPTLTAFLPDPALANGTAVIIAPGGGYHTLSCDNEGSEVAKWLNSKGIAAFMLKYRLVRSLTDDPPKEMRDKLKDRAQFFASIDSVVTMAMHDGQAAVKYVRDNAKLYKIDPKRIGFMGFSAGAMVTMTVVYNAPDDSRPNFVAPIYGSDPSVKGSKMPTEKTPIFIVATSDDPLVAPTSSMDIYKKWLEAKQPAELHIYERGGHGFGMKKQGVPTDTWYERFGDWLKLQGF